MEEDEEINYYKLEHSHVQLGPWDRVEVKLKLKF